jgi:hypothetical protein
MGFGDKDTHPKYQGQVKDGERKGLGVIFDRFGSKYVGSWKDGFHWNEIFYDKNGKVEIKIGEWKTNKP